MSTDQISHPSHYNSGRIEVIEAIEDWKLNFHRGNAVKYTARAGKKDEKKEIEDLKKAIWYLTREIERISADKESRPVVKPDAMDKNWKPAQPLKAKDPATGIWFKECEMAKCACHPELTEVNADYVNEKLGKTISLAKSHKYFINNPSAWDTFNQQGSDMIEKLCRAILGDEGWHDV